MEQGFARSGPCSVAWRRYGSGADRVAALLTGITDQERLDAATELISGAELTDCLAEIGRNGR